MHLPGGWALPVGVHTTEARAIQDCLFLAKIVRRQRDRGLPYIETPLKLGSDGLAVYGKAAVGRLVASPVAVEVTRIGIRLPDRVSENILTSGHEAPCPVGEHHARHGAGHQRAQAWGVAVNKSAEDSKTRLVSGRGAGDGDKKGATVCNRRLL